jgi:tetratricopeptide (TPR) repeat protein
LNALGILTKKLGRYDAAIKYYKAAVKQMVFLTGSHKHAQIAEFLTNLADVYRKKSEYAQAEALYRRALEIFDQTVGSEHIECADVYNSLGLVAKKVFKTKKKTFWLLFSCFFLFHLILVCSIRRSSNFV